MPDVKLATPSSVDEEIVNAASELSATTPEPRRVRIAGRLDVMGASEAVLKIDLRPGESVTAVWEGDVPVDETRVSCSIHVAHAASADQVEDLVRTHARARGHRHVCA